MSNSKTRAVVFRTLIVAASVLASIPYMAAAQDQKSVIPTRGKPVGPIYNPHTKSYFELRIDLPRPPNWETALHFARKKIFKGVRGRLAVVKDLETHSFLRANFELRAETWIGLRYYCSFRKLVWEDGTEHPRSAFKVWARRWYRHPTTRCYSNHGPVYMPIYYLPSNKGYKWQAAGIHKYFPDYFVEYRTGSREPFKDKKDGKSDKTSKSEKSEKKAENNVAEKPAENEDKQDETRPEAKK